MRSCDQSLNYNYRVRLIDVLFEFQLNINIDGMLFYNYFLLLIEAF